jgi:hypothetical protein
MNVNIGKTQKYYHSIGSESLCDCNYCKNYYAQVKASYPEIASYLASLERGKLHPIKSGAKTTLFLKSEILKRNWQ